MDPIILVLTAMFFVAVTLAAFLPRSAARRQQLLATVSRESGLGLTPALEGIILRRAERARRYALAGTFVGWTAATWAPITAQSGPPGGLIIIGSAGVGSALGSAAAAIVDALAAPQSDLPRLARATAVSVSDYVPSMERTRNLISVAAAATASLFCALGGIDNWVLLIGMPGLVAFSAALAVIGSRYIASRPQHARTLVDLAWDDALRARNMRALFTATPIAAFYALLAAGFALGDLGGVFVYAPAIAIAAAAMGGVVVLIVGARSRDTASRHFLRHLWPETATQLEMAEQGAR